MTGALQPQQGLGTEQIPQLCWQVIMTGACDGQVNVQLQWQPRVDVQRCRALHCG